MLELGKKMQNFFELGYVSKKEGLLFSFYRGLVTGAGAFIGGTLVISVVLWILSLFNTVPFIGHIIDNVSRTLQAD